MSKTRFLLIQMVTAGALAGSALAEEPAAPPPPAPVPAAPEAAAPVPAATAVASANTAPAAAPAPPPPPYSLPWQLRPVGAVNVVRSDTAFAIYDNGMGAKGNTVATMLLGSYKVTPSLAPMVRLGFVQNDAPATAADGTSFINPIIGATYARKVDAIRWAAFLGATVPIGARRRQHARRRRSDGEQRRHPRPLGDGQRDVRGQLLHGDRGRRPRLRRSQADRPAGGDAAPADAGARRERRRPARTPRAQTPPSGCTPATSSSRCCRSAASCAISGG